jgi:hypothetical protein
MRHTKLVVLAAALAAGCGSEWHLPFSNANPTLPSNISINAPERRLPRSDDEAQAPTFGPRNHGTRVWLVPVPAGDMLRLAKEPALWEKSRSRVDVFSFYFLHTYHHDGFSCGVPCGPNTYDAFRTVVPGGMFRWLNDQGIRLAIEAASVKSHACTPGKIHDGVSSVYRALENVESAGARVSFISLDEPFMSGTNPVGAPGFGGCDLSLEQTAGLVRQFVDGVHARFPYVQIGLIEPYPHHSADTIISAVLELERLGVPVPFLHIDLSLQQAVRDGTDSAAGLRRIREFCKARSIPFGVIIMGFDGRTNEGFTEDAWATMRSAASAVGVTEDTVFQSWAESVPGNLNSRKFVPDTVPESNPVTHTGQLLRMLEYLKVQPVQ